MTILIRVAKNRSAIDIDIALIIFLLVDVLFLQYFTFGQSVINPGLALFAFIRILFLLVQNKNSVKMDFPLIGLAVILILYLFLSTFSIGQATQYWLTNAQMLFAPICMFSYLSLVYFLKAQKVQSLFRHALKYLNYYYCFNVFLMVVQINQGVDFDDITGLFGSYGTHRLTLFVCIICLLNLRNINKLTLSDTSFAYLLFIIASSALLSVFNDNTAMFVLLPIVLVMYYLLKEGFKGFGKILVIVAVATIVVSILFQVPTFQDFFRDRLLDKIFSFFNIFSNGVIGEERFFYIQYAIDYLNGSTTGVGFGTVLMVRDPFLSNMSWQLRNWGMSNLASFLAVGGTILAALLLLLYTALTSASCRLRVRGAVICFALYFVLAYYGQFFLNMAPVIMIWMLVILLFCPLRNERGPRK